MLEIQIDNARQKAGEPNFISMACRFKSDVVVVVNGQRLNGKSIMNSSIIENAETLKVIAEGIDEESVIKAVSRYYKIDKKGELNNSTA